MVAGAPGLARLTPPVPPTATGDSAPAWDRFAHWSALPARLVLIGLALLLVAAAIVPLEQPQPEGTASSAHSQMPKPGSAGQDQDLALYETAVRRVQAGENYYDFITAEHRQRGYPVRPGIAVRMPTLAYLQAGLQLLGLASAAPIALMLAAVFVWWRRFGAEPGVGRLRAVASALVFVGTSLALNTRYHALHELWAGMLLLLALGLYRPRGTSRWLGAFLCAALALFIRELAFPFVLLMALAAAWRREWREAGAWAALMALFVVALALHLSIVSAHVESGDPPGPHWLAWRGLSGWLGNVVQSSSFNRLPHWVAGPGVVLMTLGWAGWRTPVGTVAFLTCFGYALAFLLVGRWDNFYWGALIVPMLPAGLAFAPRAARSLAGAAGLK